MLGSKSNPYNPYTSSSKAPFSKLVLYLGMIIAVILLILLGSSTFYSAGAIKPSDSTELHTLTWNIAAINNNPFEYWITWENEGYVNLMADISKSMTTPGSLDVTVKDVFTETMFSELKNEMAAIGFTGIDQVDFLWRNEYKDRRIISDFLKDPLLGKKRLASMPDRMTNTINDVDGKNFYRPTVINCYPGEDLGDMTEWFKQWKQFMFKQVIKTAEGNVPVHAMLAPINPAKYPMLTKEEAVISLPLQTMCGAIFDAILVYMMNFLAPTTWQPLRSEMCRNLNMKKSERTVEILENIYELNNEVMFLQEVGKAFIHQTEGSRSLINDFQILLPSTMDHERDQNSLIMLKRHAYGNIMDVTESVLQEIPKGVKVPVAAGDLVVYTAERLVDKGKYVFASFHGDTNGLATIPIVTAVHKYAVTKKADHKLLFGMDANTYAHPESDQQGVVAFGEFYSSLKLNSCYGKKPDPENFTTFHARTYLQPQLNKAITFAEKDIKGDKNPKDFIIFFDSDFQVLSVQKDNTGRKKYVEGMVFPTLEFPSDHGITSTVLKFN